MKKIEHRNKTFEYSEEAEQDAHSQWGIDLDAVGHAGIDILLEDGVDFSSMKVQIERIDRGIQIKFEPDPK